MLCSAAADDGIDDVWDAVTSFADRLAATGERDRQRADQARAWMWSEVRARLVASITDDPERAGRAAELERRVAAGELSPSAAADELLR